MSQGMISPQHPLNHNLQGYFLPNSGDDGSDTSSLHQELNFDSSMAGRPLVTQARTSSQQQLYYAGPGYPQVVPSLRPQPLLPALQRLEDLTEMPAFGDLPALLFLGKLSPSLVCPVHKGVLIEPLLVIVCGHTFCRKCIEVNNFHSPIHSRLTQLIVIFLW